MNVDDGPFLPPEEEKEEPKAATEAKVDAKSISTARAYKLRPCSMAVFTAPAKERAEATT